ncbi:hypothetical protein U9M48_001056 [Paspalum notatum var. saurae]|uniref:Uncharacterized protein n=1 Tax=Paspalum notatum var. saurae TaxID=547442 RepID=A0AAQ3SHV5_PASNO
MGKKKKTGRESDSSSSSESSGDEMSTEEATTPPRSSSHAHLTTEARRTNRNKEVSHGIDFIVGNIIYGAVCCAIIRFVKFKILHRRTSLLFWY